jgi:hypothetical protein
MGSDVNERDLDRDRMKCIRSNGNGRGAVFPDLMKFI